MQSVEEDVAGMLGKLDEPIAKNEKDLYEAVYSDLLEPLQRRPDWDLFAQVGEEIGHHPKRPGDRPR